MRLDEYLVDEGLFSDAGAALRAVIANEVLVDDVPATSAAQMVKEGSHVRVRGRKSGKYVSRGGSKLKGAIEAFGVSPAGKRCIDVGSSTGGFTDCLLQEGASEVACVDVNYGQLAWKLRQDHRVKVFERTNIKTANTEGLGAPFDMIVIDVSFIGLASLAPTLAALGKAGTELIALVKPQFESKHEETDRGVVREESIRLRTVEEVKQALAGNGFDVRGVVESPIKGPAGNIEYLIYAILG